jgi:FkbM family methyltransferase
MYGATFRATKISLALPGSGYEVSLRLGTSDEPTFKQVFMNKEYDCPYLPDSARNIIDLGANIGLASVFFGLRYPEANLLAVEPELSNFTMLSSNVKNLGPRMKCVRAAAWKEDGFVDLQTTDATGLHLGSWAFQVADSSATLSGQTPAYRVETLIQRAQMDLIDILKVDIEGAEVELFANNPMAWLGDVKLLIIETHDWFRSESSRIVRAALADLFVEKPRLGENQYFVRRAQ